MSVIGPSVRTVLQKMVSGKRRSTSACEMLTRLHIKCWHVSLIFYFLKMSEISNAPFNLNE